MSITDACLFLECVYYRCVSIFKMRLSQMRVYFWNVSFTGVCLFLECVYHKCVSIFGMSFTGVRLFLECVYYRCVSIFRMRLLQVLESFKIMDYSLLVGVHNLDEAKREKVRFSSWALGGRLVV